jgi:serine/threonine-protein kinase
MRVAEQLSPSPRDDDKLTFRWPAAILARARAALGSGDANRALTLATRVRDRIEGSELRPALKLAEAQATMTQGLADLALHRPEPARSSLARAVELISEINDAASPWLAQAQIALGEAHLALGDRPTAVALLAKASAIEAVHPKLGEQYRRPLRELESRLDKQH